MMNVSYQKTGKIAIFLFHLRVQWGNIETMDTRTTSNKHKIKKYRKFQLSKKTRNALITIAIVLALYFLNAKLFPEEGAVTINNLYTSDASFQQSEIPPYAGQRYCVMNGNIPYFTEEEIARGKQGTFEDYGALDSLGRCTGAFDCVGRETMPAKDEKRGDISSIHPSGWHQARYDCVDSETVMTRAHLAGYMLSAENANERNLITGTRYFNSDSMLKYESEVYTYLNRNYYSHVLYRVTPIYTGKNLMADGVLMEARSVEDNGVGVCYCVFVYNVQPGVWFDYATGKSAYSGIFFDTNSETVVTDGIRFGTYTLDLATGTIHDPFCDRLKETAVANRVNFAGDVSMENTWGRFGYQICDCVN